METPHALIGAAEVSVVSNQNVDRHSLFAEIQLYYTHVELATLRISSCSCSSLDFYPYNQSKLDCSFETTKGRLRLYYIFWFLFPRRQILFPADDSVI